MLFLFAMSIATMRARADGWVSYGPFTGTIEAIAISPDLPPTMLVAAMRHGVFSSTSAGGGWIQTDNGMNDGFNAVAIYALAFMPGNPQVVLASGDNGIFRSSNGGANWVLMAHWVGLALAFSPSAPLTAYAATTNGLFRTTDGGLNWSGPQAGLQGYPDAVAVDPTNPLIAYVGGATCLCLYRTSDGGAHWQSASSGLTGGQVRTLAVDPSVPSTLFAGTTDGVFKSTNSGTDWTLVVNLPIVMSVAVAPSNHSSLLAGTFDDGAFLSTNGGATWSSLNLGLTTSTVPVPSVAFDPSSSATLYLGTAAGLLKSSDNGLSWSAAVRGITGGSALSMAVDPSNPYHVFSVGRAENVNYGRVFVSSDGAKSWSATDAGMEFLPIELLAIAPSAPATVYATWYESIFVSTNAGANWSPAAVALSNFEAIRALAVSPSNPATAWVATSGGGVFKTTDGFASWNTANVGLTSLFVGAVAIDPASADTLFVDTGDGIFKSTNGGASWSPSGTGIASVAGLTGFAFDPAGHYIYAAGFVGVTNDTGYPVVYRSGDGGATWNSSQLGAANSNFATINALAVAPDGELFAGLWDGYESGGIYSSHDHGQTWTLFGSESAAVYSLAFAGNSPPVLLAGTEMGVLRYEVVPLAFYTLSPCRIVDTRLSPGPLGGPALQPVSERTFALGGACGVPGGAKAVSVNVTVTDSTSGGDLRLSPGGVPVALTSTINFRGGQTLANNAVIGLSADGSGQIIATCDSAGIVQLIVDVNGYFQ